MHLTIHVEMCIDYMSFLYIYLVLPKKTEIVKRKYLVLNFEHGTFCCVWIFECAVKHMRSLRSLGVRGGKLRTITWSFVISLGVALYFSLLL